MPSASLVPANDPSVLFNTAGMQPLVPYLLGQKHPAGVRIANIQKCVRTGDLEDVGDNRHLSFFEMMGNWSLGDYFKEDAIKWSFEFLTNGENKADGDKGLGLDLNRLYFTCFEGDENAPRDEETATLWKSLGVPESRIYFLGADDNWWSPGENGPCGPDSEMFYDMTGTLGDLNKDAFIETVKREDIIEIWNDVFMEYEKRDGKIVGKLASKNVDTGAGLERITAVMQGKKTAYDTDLFLPAMELIKNESKNYNEVFARVVADHMRTALFMVADGVVPANKNQGYVLRRLIRRAVVKSLKLSFSNENISKLMEIYVKLYKEYYPEIANENNIQIINTEIVKFKSTLVQGIKEFEKGTDPFVLATTYGFPIEVTEELAKEKGIVIDRSDFDKKMKEHQKLSQSSSAGMFKGGLANTNEATVKLHTAHHLLLAALQQVLGSSVKQRGSNITEERLRIDFSFDRKMTDEEKQKVEKIVNDAIKHDYKVIRREMPLVEAEKLGAEMEFGAKYGEVVSVYFIEDENGNHISKEFCGGPHVEHTGMLGNFKIQKEEASSQGVRRIKAVLQ